MDKSKGNSLFIYLLVFIDFQEKKKEEGEDKSYGQIVVMMAVVFV